MKKKLGIFITLGVVLALAIAVLTLYFVPVTYMPNLESPVAIKIMDTKDNQRAYCSQNTDDYKNLMNKYNQAFSQSLLSAIFTGQTATALKSDGILDVVSSKSFDGLHIVLQLDVAGNDLVIYGHKQEVKISDAFIELSNVSGYTKTDVYFKQVGTEKTYYKFTTYANQKILYDAVNELK